ncbi:hypothetical protein [Streptomyces himalayensis]|nr:hypothetical protein [Streptomyces himalayensis]
MGRATKEYLLVIEEFSPTHRDLTAAAADGYDQGESSRSPYKRED